MVHPTLLHILWRWSFCFHFQPLWKSENVKLLVENVTKYWSPYNMGSNNMLEGSADRWILDTLDHFHHKHIVGILNQNLQIKLKWLFKVFIFFSTTYQGTQVQKERGGSKLISFLKPFRTIFQRAPRKWLKSNHARPYVFKLAGASLIQVFRELNSNWWYLSKF